MKPVAILQVETGKLDGWYFHHSKEDLLDICTSWQESYPQYQHACISIACGKSFNIDDDIRLTVPRSQANGS